jgi:hypothetical protein
MAIPHVWRTHTAGAQKAVIISNFFGLFGPNDLNKGNTIYESEMALFSECMPWCARKGLDTADIVREAMFQQLSEG